METDTRQQPINYWRTVAGQALPDELPALAGALEKDERAGVRALGAVCRKRYIAHQSEMERLRGLLQIEEEEYKQGAALIAGVDEAGRGPLAGPVFAAAVVWPRGLMLPGVNDSKKITEAQRETLAVQIKEKAVAYAVGVADVDTIETINIAQASFLAMRRALEGLKAAPDAVLVDGFAIPGLPLRQKAIIKGDAKCFSIAAASILAKTERDAWMRACHELYPMYGFDKNKGYGSAAHMEAIRRHGLCPLHRASFIHMEY